MSYSFTVRGKDKAEVKAAVVKKFDEDVVGHQVVHAKDRDAVIANAHAVIDLMAEDSERDISVSVNGWLSWNQLDPEKFTGVSISASAGHVNR